MAGSTTADLVAAVSHTGGLGSLGVGYLELRAILDQTDKMSRLTRRPCAIGLFVLPDGI